MFGLPAMADEVFRSIADSRSGSVCATDIGRCASISAPGEIKTFPMAVRLLPRVSAMLWWWGEAFSSTFQKTDGSPGIASRQVAALSSRRTGGKEPPKENFEWQT